MSVRRQTRLLDRTADQVVPADVISEVLREDLIRAHLDWQPVRLEALKRALSGGGKWPEHWHWDWSRKADKLDLLAYRCFGIEHGGQMQGLMMVSTIARRGRFPGHEAKPILYIEYIESAPWNLADLVATPRFSGVGVALLEAAIEYSGEEGFGGRIALHSLPQSEVFYRRHMEDLGVDSGHHERLRYFEMTAEQAQIFVGGRR